VIVYYEEVEMKKLKLGIIGLGRLGRRHAANIHYRIPDTQCAAS
jgi:myo-inositol 2-dehydrogenase/D-chiro-inositol 1-dehydrogenase